MLVLYEKVSKAYEVLQDVGARAAYDNLIAAKNKKHERQNQMDSKRRKLHDDLVEREKLASQKRTEADEAQRELERQMYRLRTEGRRKAQMEAEIREAMREAAEAEQEALLPKPAPTVELAVSDIDRTLRVKWLAVKGGSNSTDTLRTVFGAFGEVSHIVSNKPGTAVIEFKDIVAAHAAVTAAAGPSPPEGLGGLVVDWAAGTEPAIVKTFVKAPPAPSGTGTGTKLSTKDYENITFMRLQAAAARKTKDKDYENLAERSMRQAEERKRLLEQLSADD